MMAENEWTNTSRGPNLIRKKKIGGKGVDSIYEWGLPPDKMPGNRSDIPWTKGAEDAIGLEYDPNEAKALQKLLIQKLQTRLDELKGTFKKYRHLKGTKREIAKILIDSDFDASRIFKNKDTEGKAIRRALASMFTTDADFFAEKGVWNLLKTNLDRLEGGELFRVVKGLDAFLSGEKGGLVGHHTSLSAFRSLGEQVDAKWRVEFNRLAKEDGLRIGERGLERIQPITHKSLLVKGKQILKGALAEKLAPLMPDAAYSKGELVVVRGQYPKVDKWLDKMNDISTHSPEHYRGTQGFSVDSDLSKLTPQQAYNNARNIFDAETAIQQQGRKLNVKLNKVINKDFNFTNLDDATDFLIKKAHQIDWQPEPVKPNLIAEVDPKVRTLESSNPRAEVDRLRSLGKEVPSEDVLDRYLPPRTVDKPRHLLRDVSDLNNLATDGVNYNLGFGNLDVWKLVKRNAAGEIVGAFADAEVHKRFLEGDYKGAAVEGVKGAVIGGATQSVMSSFGVNATALAPAVLPIAARNIANVYSQHYTGKDLEEHVLDIDEETDTAAGSAGLLSAYAGGPGPNTHLFAGYISNILRDKFKK